MLFLHRRTRGKQENPPEEQQQQQPPQPAPPVIRYLITPAGVPNFGDEFITRAWLRYLAETEPDSIVWVDCVEPGRAVHYFNGLHPHLNFTNTAWSMVWKARDMTSDYVEAAEHVKNWVLNLGTPRQDTGICLMRDATSIHLLGGGYISRDWYLHALLLRIARLAKQHNSALKLYGTGLGLCPLNEINAADITESLQHFDYLTARDAQTASCFGVPLGVDDAFLGVASPKEQWQNPAWPSRLFTCLQGDVVGEHPQMVDRIVQAMLDNGADPSEPLTLIESIPPEDAWSFGLFQERWPGEVLLLPFLELWNKGVPVGEDTMWATSRFHMHLLGATTGGRGASLAFDNDYYDIKHGSLRELGTGWTTLGPEGSTAFGKNDGFAQKAIELSQAKRKEADAIYGSVPGA